VTRHTHTNHSWVTLDPAAVDNFGDQPVGQRRLHCRVHRGHIAAARFCFPAGPQVYVGAEHFAGAAEVLGRENCRAIVLVEMDSLAMQRLFRRDHQCLSENKIKAQSTSRHQDNEDTGRARHRYAIASCLLDMSGNDPTSPSSLWRLRGDAMLM